MHVLFFEVTDDEILNRLERRRTLENRADDDPDAVASGSRPTASRPHRCSIWYETRNVVRRIPAIGSVEEIADRVRQAARQRSMVTLKSPREVEIMARAGRIVAGTLARMRDLLRPGMSTEDLDAAAERFIRSHDGAVPSFKGLYGFPEDPVHLHRRRDRARDSLDQAGAGGRQHRERGRGRAARGPARRLGHDAAGRKGRSPEAERLLRVTQECLAAGIAQAQARQSRRRHRARGAAGGRGGGLRCGAGVGGPRHRDPVPRGAPGPELRRAPTRAPPAGRNDAGDRADDHRREPGNQTLGDKWTVVTADGSLAAHFEHTVAITVEWSPHPDGCLSLSAPVPQQLLDPPLRRLGPLHQPQPIRSQRAVSASASTSSRLLRMAPVGASAGAAGQEAAVAASPIAVARPDPAMLRPARPPPPPAAAPELHPSRLPIRATPWPPRPGGSLELGCSAAGQVRPCSSATATASSEAMSSSSARSSQASRPARRGLSCTAAYFSRGSVSPATIATSEAESAAPSAATRPRQALRG